MVEPFKATQKGNPLEFWSKISPTIQSDAWHDFLEARGVENWDFDYGGGFIYTDNPTETDASLIVPVNIEKTDDYVLLSRCLESSVGGRMRVLLDGHEYALNSRGQIDRFLWRQLDTVHLEKGTHQINLISVEGFNAVNLFCLIPSSDFSRSEALALEISESKRLISLIEDTDFHFNDDNASRELVKGASNGHLLKLEPNSQMWQSIPIVRSDNYRCAIRFKGSIEMEIDSTVFSSNSSSLKWNYLDSIHVERGQARVEIKSTTASEVDSVLFYTLQDNSQELEDVLHEQSGAKVVGYKEMGATKWCVDVEATEPFILSFSEAYDPAWNAIIDEKRFPSMPLFSIVNGFYINQTGTFEVTIEYLPQRWFRYGAVTSLSSFLLCVLCYIWIYTKRDSGLREFIRNRIRSILFV
jgi:hypothetical protein